MDARCPHCSSTFQAGGSGPQFCPNCGQQFTVEGPGAVGAGEAGPVGGGYAVGPRAFTPGGESGGFGGTGGGGSRRGPTPWERRVELGALPAFFLQLKQSLLEPEGFWSTVRPDGPWLDALLYAWLIHVVSSALQLPLQLARVMSPFGRLSPEQLEQLEQIKGPVGDLLRRFAAGGSEGAGSTVGMFVGVAIAFPVLLFLFAGLLHLFCVIFGAGKNGFWATFRVIGYAHSASIFGWVPCVGALASLWVIVQQIWGVARVQDSTTGKASAAVLGLFVTFCCCCCGAGLLAVTAFSAAIKGGLQP